MCASVIAKLQGSGVANTVILSVVESMEECLNDIHTSITRQVLEVVPEGNPSRSALEEVLENLENPFADLNTDSKWKKYFYSKWGVVQPVEVHLGVRYDSKINRISGNYEQVPVNDTFIYVPLFKAHLCHTLKVWHNMRLSYCLTTWQRISYPVNTYY